MALTENISLTEDVLAHTECTECTDFDFSLCSKSFINVFSAGEATASSVLSVSSVREKESSVREKNICEKQKSEIDWIVRVKVWFTILIVAMIYIHKKNAL